MTQLTQFPAEIAVPDGIRAVLCRLEGAGYKAWLVGGCVRDGMMGRPIHDWDITTDAEPAQVRALFSKTVPTGLAHGTVTVLEAGAQAEVTTFRCDGAYADSRHPERVSFVRTLDEDLRRRDFTINAMAMDLRGRVVDGFGGRADLENRLVRCVGDPDTRFREDALRMLRAIRFSAQLDFSIEAETKAAIGRCAALSAALSAERVRDELEKTLCSPRPERAGLLCAEGLLDRFGCGRESSCAPLIKLPAERRVRWAGFLAATGGRAEAFRLDKKTLRICTEAAKRYRDLDSRAAVRRCIAETDFETAACAATLAGMSAQYEEIVAAGECVSLRQLAVRGGDFPGVTGPTLGVLLNRLLLHVLAHPEDNERQRLLALAAEMDTPGACR